jgi:hypothetical protein
MLNNEQADHIGGSARRFSLAGAVAATRVRL